MNMNEFLSLQNLSNVELSIATNLANILSMTNEDYSSKKWTEYIKEILYNCAKAISPNYLVASNVRKYSNNEHE